MSKVTKKLFENFQQLDESLLTSEFTFGFELEGVVRYGTEISDITDRDYDNIQEYLDNSLASGMPDELQGHSDIHYDESVGTGAGDEDEDDYDYDDDEDGDGDKPFEYASKIIPCTPQWFNKVINCLSTWLEDGIYTNNTCGFHHHLHFNGMTERDMVWIYCNMATDEEFAKTFRKYNNTNLYHGRWASYDSLHRLSVAIIARHWDEALAEINTRKWKAFRIHPQGTLEWRGPRNFLNHGNIEIIKGFYLLFNKLIGFVKKYQSSNTLAGAPEITREELFKNLKEAVDKMEDKPDLEFIRHNEGYDSQNPIKFKTEKKGLTDNVLKKLGKWFEKDIDMFVKLTLDEDPRIGKFINYSLVKSGDSTRKIANLIKNALDTLLVQQLKEKFAKSLYKVTKDNLLKGYVLDWLIDNCNFDEYLGNDLAKERLLNVQTASDWKKLFNSYIKSSNGHVNIGVIEKSLIKLLEDRTYAEYVFGLITKNNIVNYLGKDVIARIATWLISNTKEFACGDYNLSGIERVGKELQEIIRGTSYQTIWDSCIRRYINEYPALLLWLSERPSLKELIRIVSKNNKLINYLTPDELSAIKSQGIDL